MVCSRSKFVDVFAGCGGLSLGLLQAGLIGRFAIENNPDAFATLSTNLLRRESRYSYLWPKWLAKEPTSIEGFIKSYLTPPRRMIEDIDILVADHHFRGFQWQEEGNTMTPEISFSSHT